MTRKNENREITNGTKYLFSFVPCDSRGSIYKRQKLMEVYHKKTTKHATTSARVHKRIGALSDDPLLYLSFFLRGRLVTISLDSVVFLVVVVVSSVKV